ncbi:uncharacterized protein [Chelonus insularis]|uniref:uncharacterized protein n=1 Tax=Chelonus insularis TaxID=460826 RepID=UPI00158BBEFC|nr:uncharacterized protein LOC118065161 [Chelonus insularis]
MNFLRFNNQINKVIPLFKNKYNILINNELFVIKKYSTNAMSLKMRFLNYLIPNQSNFNNITSGKQIYDKNNKNTTRSSCEKNNIQQIDIYNKTFWKQNFEKETMMLIFQKENYTELRKYLKKIDAKCCRLLNKLSTSEIIQLLNILMRIDESHITNTKFYNDAILILKIALKRDQLNYQETFLLLFFASLKKKEGAQDVKYIKKCLPSFNNLSLVDKSILADALFKCSVKLKKFEERSIEEVLENEAEFLIKEKHLLIPLCKVIRHVGPSKNFNVENFNRALINSTEHFNLMFCGHVLNLYAETKLRVDNVLLKLYTDAFASLRHNNIYRVKDIDNLVWSAAMLNYQLKDEDLSEIEKCIERKFVIFKAEYTKLLNIIISLWMLKYKSKELIHKCFRNRIFHPIIQNCNDWKSKEKLQLLISCIKIEAPDIDIPLELVDPYNLQIKVEKNHKLIYKEIQKIRHELDLVDLNITNPIKGIHIPSICMKYGDNKIAYVDLLDETTCLRNSIEPHGLMKLKLRLLTNSECKSIVIENEYRNDSNKLNEHLYKILM